MKKHIALGAAPVSVIFFLVGVVGLSLPMIASSRFEASLAHPGFALRWIVFFGIACFGGLTGFLQMLGDMQTSGRNNRKRPN